MTTKQVLLGFIFTLALICAQAQGIVPLQPAVDTSNTVGYTKLATPIAPGPSAPGDNSLINNVQGVFNLLLPAMVLAFGMIVVFFIVKRYAENQKFTPDHIIRIVSITLIVTGLLFLIAMGNTQPSTGSELSVLYAPAFGLLGTIAGYMLGKDFSGKFPHDDNTKK